jgi:hypothetical protein
MNISDKYYASYKDSSDLIQSQVHINHEFREPRDTAVSVQQPLFVTAMEPCLEVIRNSVGLIYN